MYFQRPDGRVIPRFGYRLDDMRDEYAVAEEPSAEGHASGTVNPSVEGRDPLAVREPAAVYYLPARLRPAA